MDWLARYADNCIMVIIAGIGLALNLRYVRHCPPGPAMALKAMSAIALAYIGAIQALYVVGVGLANGWYEAAALALVAVLAVNAWVGRDRGACD